MAERVQNQSDSPKQQDMPFRVEAPQLTLPKGGGALRAIAEKFGLNPVTGTGSSTVPIATSAGRGGFAPQLSITYDSGAGNGPFGFGWSLAISRKTDKGLPQYADDDESDVFILSGAEDLAPSLVEAAARGRATSSRERSTDTNTRFTATGRASKACSRASNAGATRPIQRTPDGTWVRSSRFDRSRTSTGTTRTCGSSISPATACAIC